MIVRLIKRTKIYNFPLPTTISGTFWITDMDGLGNTKNLISIEAKDDLWFLKSNFDAKIISNNKELDSVILKEYNLYFIRINNENDYILLYCSPSIDQYNIRLKVNTQGTILIGNNKDAQINYNYPLVSKKHAILTYNENTWYIQDLNSNYGTYVNNELVMQKRLYHGDIVFIMGLKIIVLGNTIIINNIGDLIKIDNRLFSAISPIVQPIINEDNILEENIELYKEEDYFFRSPRFKAGIEPVEIIIDPPPSKEKVDTTPLLYVIGPMISMGMVSLMMGYSSISNVISGEKDIYSALPNIIMCIAMLLTMIFWPLLNKSYQKKQSLKRENLRQEKYREYINEKRNTIHNEMEKERQVLLENYLPLEECYNIIMNRKRSLWEREIDQNDFLDLRLGLGSTTFKGIVKYPEERFSLEDDNLRNLVFDLGKESKELENVPINLSFTKNNISAIIGDGKQKTYFINGLILQLITFHSYNDLKIVVFTNKRNESKWEYLKSLPHIWNNSKTVRYFATNYDEAKELSLNLEQVFQSRKSNNTNNDYIKNTRDYTNFQPYYFIIIDDFKAVRELEIIKDICNEKTNIGFTLTIINNRLTNLPNECHTFISIGDKKSGVFENELVSNKQKEFIADYNLNIDMYQCIKRLANIPIEIEKENSSLPTMLSFLEMYDVGRIEQLNIIEKWKNSNATKSLQAPIGIDKNRELFKLDLHEKAHGPHGLIAGMTGSGKSELIITYILSMAINYTPNEVNFILIDYKGGGLAGAFENKEAGIKLPHLAGTITNLDTIEMKRSLASIQSELRRRQRIFNEARDTLSESTIDIYKYQTLFRENLVKIPVPHLLIISDEFAELKDQQPDFMDELISTARIGRSLGVHLILSTQKPAGVVNDQIWSNSKFRICLKVQDKSDSMDMIKCADAAALKETGRFYLQVGYNELFALGQSAFSGAKYYPMEKRYKKIDERIEFIDSVGNVINSIDSANRKITIKAEGEEITSLVRYISKLAQEENLSTKKLWLDKIPEYIYIEELKEKYNYIAQENNINPIVGEYDDPNNQYQGLLTLPISKDGNTCIYGSAGTGKELMISTIIYSTITNHSPKEVNFYLLDFGAETLRAFKEAPQIGEVIFSNEEEKIANLYKFLQQELEKRKKLLVDYNGDFNFYLNHSGQKLPLIIVIVNNYDAYGEIYETYEDIFSTLTREGAKYGITFIISAATTTSIRYKLRQNFKQSLVLQFNDVSDYTSILGNIHKKYPSKIYGRGLIRQEDVYEFQTAYPYKKERMFEYLKTISKKLAEIFEEKAKKIPTLPKNITHTLVRNALNNLKTIPVGIEKESLQIASIDCLTNYNYIISGNDLSIYMHFINNLYKSFSFIDERKVIIIDTLDIIQDALNNTLLVNQDFNIIIKKLNEDIKNQVNIYKINNYQNNTLQDKDKVTVMILGIENLLSKLDTDTKSEFTINIIDAKNLNTYNFVIIESSEKLKNMAYENWYKKTIDPSNGLWLGSGVLDQYTIKLAISPRTLRQELKQGFAVLVVKGRPFIIKLLEGEIENE